MKGWGGLGKIKGLTAENERLHQEVSELLEREELLGYLLFNAMIRLKFADGENEGGYLDKRFESQVNDALKGQRWMKRRAAR